MVPTGFVADSVKNTPPGGPPDGVFSFLEVRSVRALKASGLSRSGGERRP